MPSLPAQDVVPKAVPVALSLMKPASPLAQVTQALGGRPKPRPRTDPVTRKIVAQALDISQEVYGGSQGKCSLFFRCPSDPGILLTSSGGGARHDRATRAMHLPN